MGAQIGIDVLEIRSPTPSSPVNLDIDDHARVLSCRGFLTVAATALTT
jgi:hypothetical protein